jgi:hypothetical protein
MGRLRRVYDSPHIERISGIVGLVGIVAGVGDYLVRGPDHGWDTLAWAGLAAAAAGTIGLVTSICWTRLSDPLSDLLALVALAAVTGGVVAVVWWPRDDAKDVATSDGGETVGASDADGATTTPTSKPDEAPTTTTTDRPTVPTSGTITGPTTTAHVGTEPPATTTTAPRTTTTARRQGTHTEQQGTLGADTFLNPENASGKGTKIQPDGRVQVSCKVYAPQVESANPDGYWYRIASSPWDDNYYAVANTFWNGDVAGQPPYTHNTDFAVPDC